jgi:hypothetical protein
MVVVLCGFLAFAQKFAGPAETQTPHFQAMIPKVLAGDPLKAKSTGKHSSTGEISNTGSWSVLDREAALAAEARDEAEQSGSAAVQFIEAWKELRSTGDAMKRKSRKWT